MKTVGQVSWAITAGLLLVGLLLSVTGAVGMGSVFFVLFPISVGFASAVASGRAKRNTLVLALCAIGLLIFLVLAVVLGLEGLVCVVMALPLLLIPLFIGAGIALICQKTIWKERIERERELRIVFLPLLILLLGDPISRLVEEDAPSATITTSVVLPWSSIDVFRALRSMDTLDAEKPWLLELGLPVPYKCVLEDERVGAKRTCLFPNGHITAEITAYEPGTRLGMEVVEYDLTGRHWFHFGDAGYTFEEQGSGTRVTRNSSYRSDLRPRWYWEPLEKMGIEQEHEFVLRSLKKNLERTTP